MTKHSRARRREENTLLAATLANGPTELIDFLLPLWAGAAIGLGATEVGILLAVELAVSVVVRPVAGVLADTYERRYVAAAGAALYALSALGYALAQSAPLAYAAAAVGGAGGALLWVAVRAIISERLAEDSAVFPRLLAAQENGSWIAFLVGMTLISAIDYRGVFLACAAACVVAAVLLLTSPSRAVPGNRAAEGAAAAGLGAIGRRLRPMLFAVAFTMTAEAAISLLLVLHLQRGFGLEVLEVAFVFLPGAIAMSMAAERLHTFVVRYGRTRVLTFASLSSAAFAANLAWAPHPVVIAALWILSGLAWAAVMPIQQAVIAEASGERTGRGMGVYESASLLGALAGSLAAGALYDSVEWAVACLVAAAALLAGSVIVPRAVRSLGVADAPPPAPPKSPAEPERPPGHPEEATGEPVPTAAPEPVPTAAQEPVPEGAPKPVPAVPEPVPTAVPEPVPAATGEPVLEAAPRTPRRQVRELGTRLAAFAAAQVVLLLLGPSWIEDLFTQGFTTTLVSGGGRHSGFEGLVYGAGRIWTFVALVDLCWSCGQLLVARTRRPAPGSAPPENSSLDAGR
ncbi:MFS transporter [Streptomyces uncialis]|uniref:MFS transporter n=1 Tax=Streptomyces uncialis TaxID=1048205 RepID=UPI0033CEE6FC